MTINLNSEQVSYLKSLDSKKKQRKFLLDCLVEQITSIGKSVKISELPITKYPFSSDKFVMTANGLKPMIQEISDMIDKGEFKTWYSTTSKDVEEKFNKEAEKYMPKEDELLKFDKLILIDDVIKSKLLVRGFNEENLLNNRGLIGATIEETVNEVKKSYESVNDKKYTEEDMLNCFRQSRLIYEGIGFFHETFAQYLDSLEK